jgi:hypothetical protein
MGYRGLLLNDPYKRDRIDGCMLDIFRFFRIVCYCSLSYWGYENQGGIWKEKALKWGIQD